METFNDQQVRDAYRALFDSPNGAIVAADLMRQFGYMNKTTVGDKPHQTYFNEGNRFVVLYIHSMVNNPAVDTQDGAEA